MDSTGCTGRQVRFTLEKLSPHRLLQALFCISERHVISAFDREGSQSACPSPSSTAVPSAAGSADSGGGQKNGHGNSLRRKTVLGMTHEGRKIKTGNVSYPLQSVHITMIYILSLGRGEGEKRKTKEKEKKRKRGSL